MVATLLRLRLRLLLHTLRREGWRIVLLVVGLLWALASSPSVLGGMVWLSRQPVEVVHDVLVLVGTVLVLGWAVVPLLVPGLDDSLDIGRFATFGLRARRLVPGLLVAALLGVPTLVTFLGSAAPALAWLGPGRELGVLPAVLALALAPVAGLTCVLASRLSTGLAARVLGSRRSREISAVGGVLVAGFAVPVVVGVAALGLEGALERVPAVAAVLGWTPLGAVWAAPAALADGEVLGALGRVVVAVGTVVLAARAWAVLLDRALVSPPARGGQSRRRRDVVLGREGLGLPAVARPALAVTRRALRYWTADPRYLSALLGSVAAPLIIVVLAGTVIDAPAAVALSIAPLMGGTIGWGRHNDVAFDGTALWMHVVAGVPGWADRAGRTLATLAWSVPVVVGVAVVGSMVAGRVDLLPASLGAGLGVLCGGLAVSAVASGALIYPVPAAGANPYAAQMGAVGASLVAQLVTSVATLALCVPVLVAFGAAMWWEPAMAWVTLGVGVLGGALVLGAGVAQGGRVYDARSVRLLARLSR
ncbi:hypothetical protein J4G33_07780 [Actinotalea sp. BY-33]|uniref:ABC-2 type transport system permease protein n=1 Tax=Actinotalea soli TaxID=2819234 RepID=A0A939LRG6_9CELL|nr:hypothetical protein [Actinotalea soli]MBO1751700.1 hypothetical protein [Actinotalea soli]